LAGLIACVTGLDGAGKSTQVDELAARLRRDGRSVAVSTIWDLVLDPEFAGRSLFEKPSDADGYLAMLEPTARMYFLCHSLRESLARTLARETDVVLLNAYWYKYYSTEVGHGGDPAVLRTITSVLPEPDVTFYLRISVAEAARRKGEFSAYESGFAPTRSAEAFAAFQGVVLREFEGLAAELDWVALSSDSPPGELTDRMGDHLAALQADLAL
jgi:thymidylate kinase